MTGVEQTGPVMESSDETPLANKKRVVNEESSYDDVQILGSSKLVASGPATRHSKRKAGRVKLEDENPASEWESLPLYEFAEKLSFASVGMVRRLKAASDDEKKLMAENSRLQALNQSSKATLKKLQEHQALLNADIEKFKKESVEVKSSYDNLVSKFEQVKQDHAALQELVDTNDAVLEAKVQEAVTVYKGSPLFDQELKTVMYYVSRYFYTLGVDHSQSSGGDLSQLAAKDLYVPGLGSAVELCVATLKSGGKVAGVNFAPIAASVPDPASLPAADPPSS